MPTTLEDRAIEVMHLMQQTKQDLNDDLGPQLDIEDPEGHRIVVIVPNQETLVPALALARRHYGIAVVVFAADVTVHPVGNDEQYDALAVTAMNTEGQTVSYQCPYEHVGSDYIWGETEPFEPLGGSQLLSSLREGLGL